jgi:transcriptional regulator with XRE-family HTH domain
MISLEQKTSYEIVNEVAARVRKRRKELKLTQAQLAAKSGMSLGSYKRFEQTGQISFQSLAAISIALDCEGDFDKLFSQRKYRSIQEVIDETAAANRRRK